MRDPPSLDHRDILLVGQSAEFCDRLKKVLTLQNGVSLEARNGVRQGSPFTEKHPFHHCVMIRQLHLKIEYKEVTNTFQKQNIKLKNALGLNMSLYQWFSKGVAGKFFYFICIFSIF